MLLLSGLLGRQCAEAQTAPAWVSAHAEGNASITKGAAAVDATGNLYEAGGFAGTAVVGNVTLTSQGSTDSYLAKYTPAGALSWVRVLGSAGEDIAYDLALDAAGNAYLAGTFQGSVALGNNLALTGGAGAGPKAFLVRYSPQGTPEWVQQSAVSGGVAIASSVGLDATGHVYLTGIYSAVTFGTASLTMPTTDLIDVFLARFSAATGTVQSLVPAIRYPGANRSAGEHPTLAVAPSGAVYLFANFFGTPMLGNTTLTPRGLYDVLVARFDAQGGLEWVQQAGGPGSDLLQEGVVDAAGNLYTAGFFDGTATFGSTPVSSAGSFDGYLAKYTPAGQVAWVQTSRGPGFDGWYGVSLDAGGNPCVAGGFAAVAQFGPFTLTSTGPRDVAVAAYTPQGQVRWVQQAGGPGFDVANHLGCDAAGDFHVLGLFNGTCAFGALALSAPSADQTFVARLRAVPPGVAIEGDSLVCNGGSATLTAVPTAPVAAYRWSTGATTASITVTQPGTYSVLVTFRNGGSSTASFRVQALVPSVAIAGDTLLCPGAAVLLRAVTGPGTPSYRWSTGATTPTLSVAQPGTYTLTTSHGAGCAVSTSHRVRMPTVRINAPPLLCAGTAVLTAVAPGATAFRWSTGSTSPSLAVGQSGTFTVVATFANGCTLTASASVAVPVVRITGDTLLCPGRAAVLTASLPGATAYRWNTGASTANITATQPGTYQVTVSYGTGCTTTAVQFVRAVLPLPPLSIGPDTLVCDSESLLLAVPLAGRAFGPVTYRWSDGSSQPFLRVRQPGSYSVNVSSACGSRTFTRRVDFQSCLFLPNVITPNHDGRNEAFIVRGLPRGAWALTVYNRWGREVYHVVDYRNEWGAAAPPGLYYYLLQRPGQSPAYKGWVEVLP